MPHIVNGDQVISYSDEGSGPAVILLHSSGSSSAQWRALSAVLKDRYRVLAVDLHDYGQTSPWSGDTAMNLSNEAQLLEPIMEMVEGKPHLVGHSHGGAVSMIAALQNPDKIASLTLIEPVMFAILGQLGDKTGELEEIRSVSDPFRKLVKAGALEDAARIFVDYWSGTGAWDSMRPERQPKILATIPKIMEEFDALYNEPTNISAYGSFKMPVILIKGGATRSPTAKIIEFLSSALPDAQYKEIPGAGHMSPITHPNEVNAAIEGFLENGRFER